MPVSQFKNNNLHDIIIAQINSLKILDEKIKINYENENENIKLKCDFNQLSRVFLNILKNSHESKTSENKNIFIKILDKNDSVDIFIEDNGSGFPENRD